MAKKRKQPEPTQPTSCAEKTTTSADVIARLAHAHNNIVAARAAYLKVQTHTTQADIDALKAQGAQALAEGHCLLNNWRWPEWLPNPPSQEERREIGSPAANRVFALMVWIEHHVGDRLISRVWNADMSDEEFEDFWRGTHEGDEAAAARYWARVGRDDDDDDDDDD